MNEKKDSLQIKIIIDDCGIATVYKNRNLPLSIEIVEVDHYNEDFYHAKEYWEQLAEREDLITCREEEYSVAKFNH